MLKVILIVDCNICGQPFDHVASSADRDPLSWKALLLDLEDTAVNCGWSFYRSAHYCGHCMTDMEMFRLRQTGGETCSN